MKLNKATEYTYKTNDIGDNISEKLFLIFKLFPDFSRYIILNYLSVYQRYLVAWESRKSKQWKPSEVIKYGALNNSEDMINSLPKLHLLQKEDLWYYTLKSGNRNFISFIYSKIGSPCNPKTFISPIKYKKPESILTLRRLNVKIPVRYLFNYCLSIDNPDLFHFLFDVTVYNEGDKSKLRKSDFPLIEFEKFAKYNAQKCYDYVMGEGLNIMRDYIITGLFRDLTEMMKDGNLNVLIFSSHYYDLRKKPKCIEVCFRDKEKIEWLIKEKMILKVTQGMIQNAFYDVRNNDGFKYLIDNDLIEREKYLFINDDSSSYKPIIYDRKNNKDTCHMILQSSPSVICKKKIHKGCFCKKHLISMGYCAY